MSLKLAVNTRYLLPQKLEGFGRFTDEIFKRVVRNHPEVEFHFLFDRQIDQKFIYGDNVQGIKLNPPARHPILFNIWYNISLRKYLDTHNFDCFISPDGFMSMPYKGKQLGIIHDLNFEHHPQDLQPRNRKYLRKNFPKFAHKATRLGTVSEYSKEDICKTYGVSADKIDIIHNAASDYFQPISNKEKESVRSKYSKGAEYFLFVGALHPRKNISRLLKAYDSFRTKSARKIHLVIVGERYWWNSEMEGTYNRLKFRDDIIFTGHQHIEELARIMASAEALAFVSYFEGFGIPLVEAMRAHTPIIAGDKTSLPEIAGDAAIYVDPFSTNAITEGMLRLTNEPGLRAKLVEAGIERAKDFSWDLSADAMWNSILKTIG